VDAAAAAADELGYPVVLKLDVDGLAHKSDVGGVRLGLRDADAVRVAAGELLALALPAGAAPRGLLVEPVAPAGVELIVGMERDAQFGPAVLVGLGGILAEALDDVAIGLAPVPRDAARAMLDRLRGARLLDGYRGRPAIDVESVVDIIVALGALAIERPDIAEIDMNPVIAGPRSSVVVDALVVLSSPDLHDG
jgi:acetyl-CoA synthetase